MITDQGINIPDHIGPGLTEGRKRMKLIEKIYDVRALIKDIATRADELRRDPHPFPLDADYHAVREVFDNLTLAYRHLEDAAMRLDKAVQALDGGKSCYPR